MSVDPLRGKCALVLGYGRQGRALARWLPTLGARVIVSDRRAIAPARQELPAGADVRFLSGEQHAGLLDDADLLCLSGGVAADAPIVASRRAGAAFP